MPYKIKNFKRVSKNSIFILFDTKGCGENNITIKFMKLKMKEYDELKNELNKSKLN